VTLSPTKNGLRWYGSKTTSVAKRTAKCFAVRHTDQMAIAKCARARKCAQKILKKFSAHPHYRKQRPA
jgi:hypothetical protein